MPRFEQLQELWQKQPERTARVDPVALAQRIRAYGRRQNWVSVLKLAAVVSTVTAAAGLNARSAEFLAGWIWIGCGAVAMIGVDWWRQRRIARFEFAEPSLAFVRTAVERLAAQRDTVREQHWIFVVMMMGGSNLMVYGAAADSQPVRRVLIHLGVTLACAAGFRIGLRIRRRRFDRDARPLLDQLLALKASLEEARP